MLTIFVTSCSEKPKYKSGEIIVQFVEDVTKEEVDLLLSSYNLSSEGITFSSKITHRVDFKHISDSNDFINYLKDNGFTKVDRPNVHFLFTTNRSINYKRAREIIYSNPNGAIISNINCFDNVWGIVKVPEDEEKKWMAELEKNTVVKGAELNFLIRMVGRTGR